MVILNSNSDNTAYNLALEQILLRDDTNDYLLFYRNKPCIVIGRFQVPYAEINYQKTLEYNIPIYRRLSGGGAVYHDINNLNFAFIGSHHSNRNNYAHFNAIIIDSLKKIGLTDIQNRDTAIICNDKKISGIAQYKYKNRILHHGTLLINSNLLLLSNVLQSSPLYMGRFKKSEPMQVDNLANFLISSLSTNELVDNIINACIKSTNTTITNAYPFSNIDIKHFEDYFNSNLFIYGLNPPYCFNNNFTINKKVYKIYLETKKSNIVKVVTNCEPINELFDNKIPHTPMDIRDYFTDKIPEKELTNLLKHLF